MIPPRIQQKIFGDFKDSMVQSTLLYWQGDQNEGIQKLCVHFSSANTIFHGARWVKSMLSLISVLDKEGLMINDQLNWVREVLSQAWLNEQPEKHFVH